MIDGFSLPPSAAACLADFDSKSAAFGEISVFGAIKSALDGASLSVEERAASYAEITAFNLMADAKNSPWNTYFGPMMSGTTDDGKPFYSPDIADNAKGAVQYWEARAQAVSNPILKARYADVAWDLAEAMGSRRNPANARLAIQAYMGAANFHESLFHKLKATARAMDLAIMIRDADLVEGTRKLLLSLHRQAVDTRTKWWFAVDRLLDNKRAGLTPEERQLLIDDLEALLLHFSDQNPSKFNPHDVQSIAERLMKIYLREEKPSEVKRLHAAIGKAFEHFGSIGDGLLGSMVLDTAVSAYTAAGMAEEASAARLLLEKKVAQAHEEMVPVTAQMEITKEEMDEYLSKVVVDDPGQTLANVAMDHLAKKAEIEELIAHTAEEAPLSAMIGRSILADTHVAGKVGSVEDDPFGRLLQQALQNFQFSNIWLKRALAAAMERHKLPPEGLAAFTNRAGLYDDSTLLIEGFKAWVSRDFIKAIHVLVPQIEHGLRSIVGKMGKPVTKPHKPVPGVSVAKNMGDILFDKEVTTALGVDLTLHLQALYTDPRGWNVRNELAHGLLNVEAMNEGMAQWIVHTLLLLGLWGELSRRAQAQQPAPA